MKDISHISPEKIWGRFKNRYEIVIRCAHLVRKLLEEQREGRLSLPSSSGGADAGNIFVYALKRILEEDKRKRDKDGKEK